jgi:hypothetical protein
LPANGEELPNKEAGEISSNPSVPPITGIELFSANGEELPSKRAGAFSSKPPVLPIEGIGLLPASGEELPSLLCPATSQTMFYAMTPRVESAMENMSSQSPRLCFANTAKPKAVRRLASGGSALAIPRSLPTTPRVWTSLSDGVWKKSTGRNDGKNQPQWVPKSIGEAK